MSIVDVATGATAHAAILKALIRRGVTGRGAHIGISMFDVMADWLTVPLLNHEGGRTPQRIGMAHPSIAPYGAFRTRDDSLILIAIQNNREWLGFCEAVLGDAALAGDPRFATNVNRVTNRQALDALVAARIGRSTRRRRATRDALEGAGVAFATVNDMEGLSAHPQLRRITVDTPQGPVAFSAPGPVWAGEDRHYGRVPALGDG